ncbi:hypothetical protein N7468_008339 [Penicillium chermesinum]|uniref:Pentatricopeptide repeat-containing protein-mitochondrial domain-containing protein n=1 Tax=Penicillium chermesinum TaxID=63820 RepID=A0A9W9NPL0_9EURO|nr:uncharacterized protein N7468_008339 [Penicillium chermesinum]KAJ5223797.1 hypothetical protein N7468_008339 [Penicillium chermesinum]
MNEPDDAQNRPAHSDRTGNGEQGSNMRRKKARDSKADYYRMKASSSREFRKIQDELSNETTSDLEFALRTDPVEQPDIRKTIRILRILLHDRQVQPGARHYTALINANADLERGSPATALAVHPDYVLRQNILRKLRERWMVLSPEGWHFVVCGLIRENQFELALDHMSEMERKKVPIETWLYKTMVYNLCELEEFDEVYRLVKSRLDLGYETTDKLWAHVLRAAIKGSRLDLTRYMWQRLVDLEYLFPSADVCRKAFALAAEKVDFPLVVSVARFCTRRDIPLPEYQEFLQKHLALGADPDTFKALSVVHQAGLPINVGFTTPVLDNLIQTNADPREEWQTLKHLKNDGLKIPLESIQIVIELCEHIASRDPSVVDDALGFYRDLESVCPDGADVEVFNAFLRVCRNAKRHDSGMTILKEMTNHGVVPDRKTFETLILMCLDARQYRSAYMYFVDFLKRNEPLSPDTQMQIRQICAKSVHEFAMKLQYHPAIKDDQSETPVEPAAKEPDVDSTVPWRPFIHREQAGGEDDSSANKTNDTL